MTSEPGDERHKHTGGAYIGGSVDTRGGDFVGRDYIKQITNIFLGDTEQQRDFRNRQNMLQLVWNTWIEGVLNPSLQNKAIIDLDMETNPDALIHPWDMVIQIPDKESVPVKPGTTILEIFNQANRSLLLLGEPGSGKTTMLLELCRQLIKQAEEDTYQQIPVIFNLSTWKPDSKKTLAQAFADWLVSELKDKYFVPNKISRLWIEKDFLVLLLDGLDEISGENLDICVNSINAFLAEHSMPLVVCSRTQEYEALSTKFALHGALLIQPITDRQLDDYMKEAGKGLVSVEKALKRDPELQEFAKTPLILNILTLAYQDASEDDLIALEKSENYRKHLFDVYIDQMFRRRTIRNTYKTKNTLKWLSWIALTLVERKQTTFLIEGIQPSWLTYSKITKRLIFWLVYGLIFGLLLWLDFLILFIIGNLSGFGQSSIPFFDLFAGLILLLIVCLIVGLIPALIFGITDKKPTDTLRWSWKNIPKGLLKGLLIGLLVGLLLGLGSLLYLGLELALEYGGLESILFYPIIGGLIGGLLGGLDRMTIDLRSRPGIGITTSLKNYIIVVSIISLIVTLITWGYNRQNAYANVYPWYINLIVSLIFGLNIGLIVGLVIGGDFLVKNYTTRILLYRSKNIPWRLIDFLEYAKERIFLRRVGGGYIFIHRMLMEHFAAMAEHGETELN